MEPKRSPSGAQNGTQIAKETEKVRLGLPPGRGLEKGAQKHQTNVGNVLKQGAPDPEKHCFREGGVEKSHIRPFWTNCTKYLHNGSGNAPFGSSFHHFGAPKSSERPPGQVSEKHTQKKRQKSAKMSPKRVGSIFVIGPLWQPFWDFGPCGPQISPKSTF